MASPTTPFHWLDYLAIHRDLTAAGLRTEAQARSHYEANGKREGRATHSAVVPGDFQAAEYARLNADPALPRWDRIELRRHYHYHGHAEQRPYSAARSGLPPDFDALEYLQLHDLPADTNAVQHYLGGGEAHRRRPYTYEARVFAIVFPQFHPTPENDRLWGKDFTEWVNVREAQPVIEDQVLQHPHASIGYYNLLDRAARLRYRTTARQYGLYGFMYWHYWFEGKPLLHNVVGRMLEDGEPDTFWWVTWANEKWTRRWHGGNNEVFFDIAYDDRADWDRHFDFLLRYFRHPKYMRTANRPWIGFYRFAGLPGAMLDRWNALARSHGFDGVYVRRALAVGAQADTGPVAKCDGPFEFHPNLANTRGLNLALNATQRPRDRSQSTACTLLSLRERYQKAISIRPALPPAGDDDAYLFGVFTRWDNSPRYWRGCAGKKPLVTTQGNADDFRRFVVAQLRKYPAGSRRYLVLNAWNEWGEGCVLEPSAEFGFQYLEALRSAIAQFKDAGSVAPAPT